MQCSIEGVRMNIIFGFKEKLSGNLRKKNSKIFLKVPDNFSALIYSAGTLNNYQFWRKLVTREKFEIFLLCFRFA